MKVSEVTRERFALWSLERDVAEGCQRKGTTWNRLPPDERQLYLDEAGVYFELGADRWPLDVLDRLEK